MRNKPDYLTHTVLILGVILFALPVWLVLAGSTQDSDAIARGELSFLPRTLRPRHLLARAHRRHHGRAAGLAHAAGLARHGAGHRARQDRHLAALRLRRRVLPLPVPPARLLGDLHHADAAGRSAHHSHLRGDGRLPPDQHLHRPDHAADRLGHRDAAVPPGLRRDPRRAGRSRAHGRRRTVAFPVGHPDSRSRLPTSPRCSSSCSSTAGTSSSGRCWSRPTRSSTPSSSASSA